MKPQQISSTKSFNPKDFQGLKKIPFHLWPETATMVGAMNMLEGALKYGRSNYRGKKVKASVYFDAIRRHSTDWFEGANYSHDSLLRCLGGVLASTAILVDAEVAGVLIDDRMYPNKGYEKLRAECEAQINMLAKKFAGRNPHHYSLLDLQKRPAKKRSKSKRRK